jgi:hypothetical protein
MKHVSYSHGQKAIEERTRGMNITLHRTLMVCMLAGALALTIALVAAKDVSAAPSPELAGGATQISGDAVFDAPAGGKCPDPPPGVASDYPPLVMTGSLDGCLYTDILTTESSPSGTYRETGTELFVGSYLDESGTFETTYRFEAKYEDVANLSGEIFGRCQHPIVEGSGTGIFEGVSGQLFFKDEVESGTFLYRGHLRY